MVKDRIRGWSELSQADLADKVGGTRQTIANIERGNNAPSVYLALAIAGVLGTTVEELFQPAGASLPAGTGNGDAFNQTSR